jgi:hypothetical protein
MVRSHSSNGVIRMNPYTEWERYFKGFEYPNETFFRQWSYNRDAEITEAFQHVTLRPDMESLDIAKLVTTRLNRGYGKNNVRPSRHGNTQEIQ